MRIEDTLHEFIDWARENSSDAWDIYENQDEFVDKYLQHLKEQEEI
jgi:2-hydroxy-3-keto-5-methylthiopentenyl-1-phosphate phosphatase